MVLLAMWARSHRDRDNHLCWALARELRGVDPDHWIDVCHQCSFKFCFRPKISPTDHIGEQGCSIKYDSRYKKKNKTYSRYRGEPIKIAVREVHIYTKKIEQVYMN